MRTGAMQGWLNECCAGNGGASSWDRGRLARHEREARILLQTCRRTWRRFLRAGRPRSQKESTPVFQLVIISALIFIGCCPAMAQQPAFDVVAFERARVLKAADQYMKETPITITASKSPRSAGGVHDFFSEGDYWWPDPNNPDAPYIQRDGMTN
jgi:alginate lyase